MGDSIDRKHASRRRDSDACSSTEAKERDNSRAHDKRSAYDERHRRRDRYSYSHRSEHTRHDSESKTSRDVRFECNISDTEKSHQLNEWKNTTTDVNDAKGASTTVAIHDAEFNWEEHRSVLDALFFQEEDIIKRGSVEYDEFWVFLRKYQAFGRKQLVKTQSLLNSAKYSFQPNRFKLPEKYDKHYRVNVSLLSKDVKGLLHRRQHHMESLTEERVAAFRGILLHYVDFLQKQKFAQLVKVKHDQQKLPIYEHRQEIVDAIARHQVVVVAGDTGCGKSTQVPQYLLSAGYTHIACTQPRRIACISLSRRVAYETLNEYGSEVAYQVCIHCVSCNRMFVKYLLLLSLLINSLKNRILNITKKFCCSKLLVAI